jgi:hypothetical protein
LAATRTSRLGLARADSKRRVECSMRSRTQYLSLMRASVVVNCQPTVTRAVLRRQFEREYHAAPWSIVHIPHNVARITGGTPLSYHARAGTRSQTGVSVTLFTQSR